MNKKLPSLILIFSLFFQLTPAAFADGGTSGDYLRDIATKFGRGIKNILISPGEIPCDIVDDTHQKGFVGVFTGFGMGTVYMLRRILVGTTEAGTFVIPAEPTLPGLCQVQN